MYNNCHSYNSIIYIITLYGVSWMYPTKFQVLYKNCCRYLSIIYSYVVSVPTVRQVCGTYTRLID